MVKLSSFGIAAGTLGIAAAAKVSAFAAAFALLGFAGAAEAGSLGRPSTAAPQSQWLSLDALQSKVQELG